jgi:hypothetical protein
MLRLLLNMRWKFVLLKITNLLDFHLNYRMSMTNLCMYVSAYTKVKVKVRVEVRLRHVQSVNMCGCQVHSGTCDRILFSVWKLLCCLCGALSDERSGLPPVSHCHQYLVHCQKCNIIYIVHVTCFMYMQHILNFCQHRLSTADHAPSSVTYTTTAV